MLPRSPIVTILGHVDHGKTTLLDYIRKTKLTEKEHGGITQKIGAYEIHSGIKGYATDRITFIDTPGHEAFTKLRARGSNVADIALLVIDAKDSIKPQTVESISHIKAAQVPFIVVINKIDLPDAKPEKVKIDLMKHEVIVEDKGGDVPTVLISAQTGKGVPELLETILLLSADKNLQYDPQATPEAYIIESAKDRRGVVLGVIIKNGELKKGQVVYADGKKAHVRSMTSDQGKVLDHVVPSAPFELLGFSELPEVGSIISTDESQTKPKQVEQIQKKPFSVDDLFKKDGGKKLALILKADTQGSLEAIKQTLLENKNVNLILSNVGEISKSDTFLAKASKAIVIGFNVKPSHDIADLAKQEKVVIKTYNIIYELLEELTEVADLLREKEEQEKSTKGEAKIAAIFVIQNEKIFGVRVTKGKAKIGDSVELYRDGKLVTKSKLISLRIHAKPIEEVKKDQEAGMLFSPLIDIKVGDVVKFVL